MVLPNEPAQQRFASQEAAGPYYLMLLRDGTPQQKVVARAGLADVFERRGRSELATELLESNVQAGVRDPSLFRRLASLYHQQGQLRLAGEALAEAARLTPVVAASNTGVLAPRLGRGGPPPGSLWRLPATLGVVGAAFAIFSLGGVGLPRLSLELLPVSSDQAATVQGDVTAETAAPLDAEPPSPPTAAAGPTSAAAGTPGCAFQLGFAELRRLVGPATVGDCLEEQRFTENGDAHQQTAGGVLIWRKADNYAAFTDGHSTWINGPNGLEQRLNGQRLAWERAEPGSILPARRIISYYGNPLSTGMGILGEVPPPEMLARLRQQAEAYAAVDPNRPVQPALELVAIVAQAGPGPDRMYRLRMDPALIEQVAQWAESNGWLLILDVQPGRSSVAAEVQSLVPFLKRPYVHLALDPEFTMRGNQLPGEAIGSVDAAAINATIRTLGELVSAEKLPPKLLIVHRFTEHMLTNYRKIEADPRVQVAIVMDGFGGPAAKISKYHDLIRDQPVQHAGFKLFYRQDAPVMAPDEVLKLDPRPDVVIYQ